MSRALQIKDFPDYYATDKGNICKCCQGKRKTAGGYQWKYK